MIQVLERKVDKQMWKVFSKMLGMKEVLHGESIFVVIKVGAERELKLSVSLLEMLLVRQYLSENKYLVVTV